MNRFRAMGCDVAVAGAGSDESARIRALFEELDAMFSRFRPDSELCRVNAARGAVAVSERFAAMVETALWAARATGGLVDPTVARAVAAAGYDRDFSELRPHPHPAGAAVPADHRAVRLLGRVLVSPPLDLNGVVKAVAVDRAVSLLAGPGWVSAGGDLAARGPVDVALPAGGAVRLVAGGLATSGTTRRRWLRAGDEQHHLIDPRSGAPARSPWTEVTVAGRSCLDADVAAKAALLLGADGPAWLDARGLPGRLVGEDGSVVETRAWSGATEAACI